MTDHKDENYGAFPKCPYCGLENSAPWELNLEDGDDDLIECDCGETYRVECSISINYTSSVVKS